ncbi:endonuclease III domain-containing protein [Pontivivens ytuae]|uniref:Fe-S cluster assembly protein HesB n=1 Tax=Pontivivens ytuae TaxID=2789856 RepID=A0A7S9LSA9_9RHOB|nr:Fe-S cluster assembly protein HesB [Pontivivens ytuae]QPH54184.1 Fe-S cluster assembly protein HesB [Pontivivens ytuae]
MQLALNLDGRPALLAEIHRRLMEAFGPPTDYSRLDPVSQLVLAQLSGRTKGAVSKAAFRRLWLRYGSWAAVRDASEQGIRDTIHDVTFPETKAPQIQGALAAISGADGVPSLERIGDLPVPEALEVLERLPGVGRKVAAAILNFSTWRRPALVVDSHHVRVLRRVGVIGARATVRQAYDIVMPLLPPNWSADDLDAHHQVVKILGQRHCRPTSPSCHHCPIADLCRSARVVRGADPPPHSPSDR